MPSEEILSLNFEEMKKAGLPVKQGVRQFHVEDKKDARAVASGIWVPRWAKHAAINYPIVSKSLGIREFEDCAKDVPCFCVGIGPSLDGNIKDLKTAQKRSLIFSTDAALKPLLANGIIPHVVMSFDCGENQKTLLEDIPYEVQKKIFLVLNSCTHPDTIASWQGTKVFFNQYHQQDEFIAKLLPYIYPKTGQLPSVGTVGNMLIVMAHFFGIKAIHLVGMDLCYGEGEKQGKKGWQYRAQDYSFVDGSYVRKDNNLLYENDARVIRSFEEEINGVKYRVDPELKLYREAILSVCEALKIYPIDCSTGVLNQYFPTKSISDCIMLHCRGEITKYRTVLTNSEEFFNVSKNTFNQSITATWATVKNLSETYDEAVTYGHGA